MRVLNQRRLARRAASMILVLTVFVAGCAAPARHAALDQADAAVERARGAPRVRALAAAELDRAETALEHARAAARAGVPPDQVEHLAYIVSQRAALAEARAAERVAGSELGKLQRALDQPGAQGPRQSDRRLGAFRPQDQFARVWVKERPQARASLEADREGAALQEWRQGRDVVDRDRQQPAPMQEDRPSVEAEQPARPSLGQDQRERTSVQENQHAPAPLEQDQQKGAALQEWRQARDSVKRDRQQPAPMREDRSSVEVEQQARPSSGQDQRERMSVQENQHAPAPLELDLREEGTAVQEERQGSARLERERRAGPWLQDEPEIRAALAQEDRQGRTAAPSPLAAIVEAVPQDVTLSLAQLPFEGAEPTNDALEELAALAERLLRELGPRVLIEADFNLPDPEARTVVERRVEVVRAILVRRGIEPARLVVRAAGGGPVQQPVTAPFVESPD